MLEGCKVCVQGPHTCHAQPHKPLGMTPRHEEVICAFDIDREQHLVEISWVGCVVAADLLGTKLNTILGRMHPYALLRLLPSATASSCKPFCMIAI